MIKKYKFIFNLIILVTGFYFFLNGYKIINNKAHIAFVQVVLSDTRANALENFNREVSKLESVEQYHMIAGSFDYLLKVRTKNISQFRIILAEKISSLPNVASTSTFVSNEKAFNEIKNLVYSENKKDKKKVKSKKINIEKKEKNQKKIINSKTINYKKIIYKIQKNTTFIQILDKFFTSEKLKYEIVNKIEKIYDLRKIRTNQEIYFYKSDNDKIVMIKIPIENSVNLNVFLEDNIKVEKQKLQSILEANAKEYIIKDSLYADGIKNNVPADILTKLIKLYSFDLDFQRDIRINTKVSLSYNSIIIEDRKEIFYGDILYSLVKIDKNILEYYRFKTDDGFIDYFNKKGENVKKSILKTPLDGARLSSGFGVRKHPILGYNKMHKGVDFAAPMGTPVYAGGNGIIEFAGYNGGYGKFIKIRHNNEYKTAYAHLSGFKKGISKGVRVNQGDVIGYVGSTGRSTGPHLHYEILFQDKQINPLKLKLPSGKKLKGKELYRFIDHANITYASHLNLLYE